MTGIPLQLLVAAFAFGVPALVARLCPPPKTGPDAGVLVTRFRRCATCAATQACVMHSDGSHTCLTCMTDHPIERQR